MYAICLSLLWSHFFKITRLAVIIIMATTTTTTTTAALTKTVFPQANHFVSKENYRNEFSAHYPPVATVQPGEFIHVETNDCFHGKIHPDLDEDPGDAVMKIPRDQRNPITGPTFATGAMPGVVLAVELLDIWPSGVGVACCGPYSGQLCHWIEAKPSKSPVTATFFDLSADRTIVTMRESLEHGQQQQRQTRQPKRIGPISFPTSPMLGVIGVAPAGTEGISTIPAGKHGGNLDNNCNGIGSTVYLLVNHPGALLSIGDMHASQGDGEISGNGVEIGGDVLLRCAIIKQKDLYPSLSMNDNNPEDGDNDGKDINLRLEFPVTETTTHWITHGVMVENIPQTTNVACEEAAKLLMGQWGFTIEEAFIFLSVKGYLGLCQSCNPDQGTQIAKMTVPKLDVCPRPFRTLWDTQQK